MCVKNYLKNYSTNLIGRIIGIHKYYSIQKNVRKRKLFKIISIAHQNKYEKT